MKFGKNYNNVMTVALILIFVILAFNSYRIGQLDSGVTGNIATGIVSVSASVIPEGIPDIYGGELGVSFDDVSPTDPSKANEAIEKLSKLDRTLELTGSDLERYIEILYKKENGMSCEYCCGARSIIFEDGSSACGCAHSYAMRGLTKYLITNHGDEYSYEELLEEVGKWKTLFFPNQITQKAKILESQDIETNYVNLASNKYRGVEKGSGSGGMVGGC
jgi:hypothetical protein